MSRSSSKPHAAPGGTPDDVEAAFYDSVRNGNLDQLMACWADEDDIACIHPGGTRLLGVAAIRASFEALFARSTHIPVTVGQVHRIEAAGSSVHHVLERIDVLTAQGSAQGFVLATNVYHLTPQGWRMVVHHASPGSSTAVQDPYPNATVLH